MTEFLTPAELRALEKAIAKARAEPGTHHQLTRSGDVVAFRYINEIKWVVSHRRAKVAHGTIPLVKRKTPQPKHQRLGQPPNQRRSI